jgi:hypothetical protein
VQNLLIMLTEAVGGNFAPLVPYLRKRSIVLNSLIVSVFANVYRSFCRHNLAGIATLD